jgi:GntR family transcriptional repressor for pyruvate dehydrogenase complex
MPARAQHLAPAGKAFEVVLHWIEERILNGQLRVGDLLPAERDLAGHLGVSRAAVREAVRTLQAHGVLRSSVGAGAAGGTMVTAVPGQALVRLLRLHAALHQFSVSDMIDGRVALERLSVQLATTHPDPQRLAVILSKVEEMEANRGDRERFNDADTAFHVAIAEAAGNRLVADMTVAIRESMRIPLMDSFRHVDDWDSLVVSLQEDHWAIYRLMCAGDADQAAARVERHIRQAWARLEPTGS